LEPTEAVRILVVGGGEWGMHHVLDWWLQGKCITELALLLFAAIPKEGSNNVL
jgi:hypothetical protein